MKTQKQAATKRASVPHAKGKTLALDRRSLEEKSDLQKEIAERKLDKRIELPASDFPIWIIGEFAGSLSR